PDLDRLLGLGQHHDPRDRKHGQGEEQSRGTASHGILLRQSDDGDAPSARQSGTVVITAGGAPATGTSVQLRGPGHGPRTPPAADSRPADGRLLLQGSSAAGARTWPPHSPSGGQPSGGRPFTSSRLFSCGGPDMAPALPQWRTAVRRTAV